MSAIAWTTIENAIQSWIVAGSGIPGSRVVWSVQGGPQPANPYITIRAAMTRRIGHDWTDTEDNPLTFAPLVVTGVDTGTDTLAIVAHGLNTGDGPVRVTSTGAVPTGTLVAHDYWTIKTGTGTLKLAESLDSALAGTAVDLQSAGTGAITVVATDDTRRNGAEIEHKVRGVRRLALTVQCFADAAIGATGAAAILSDVVAALALPSQRAAFAAAGVGIAAVEDVEAIEGVVGSTRLEPRALLRCVAFTTSEISETATYIERVEVTNEDTAEAFEI